MIALDPLLDDEVEADAEGFSALFTDLGAVIEAGLPQELPTVAIVAEGMGLLYGGRTNEIHGEPGTGKTNVALAFAVRVIEDGGHVLFLDPEDTPRGIASRLSAFGLTAREVSERFHYMHNPAPEDFTRAHQWIADHPCGLVVVDGLAETLASAGVSEDKPDELLPFFRDRIRPFSDAGAAVLISDHVVKSTESRGRWMRGSGAKMGRYDGAVYVLELIEGYSPTRAGSVRLKVAKDRVGGVGVVGQTVAELHFRPEDKCTELEWKKPDPNTGPFRPTELMAKIIRHLRINPDASKTELRGLGKADYVDKAIACLEEDGDLKVHPGGPGKQTKFQVLEPEA